MDSSLVRFCYQRLHSMAKLFRFVELCIALVFFSWLSTRLPFAVRISGEYCRRFSAFIVSPTSIFLLGNAIVLTLLAKSGLFSSGASPSAADDAAAELYEEFRSEIPAGISSSEEGDEIVFQDKEIICENTKTVVIHKVHSEEKAPEVKASYQRSKSEKVSKESEVKNKEKLRRSETDTCRRDFDEATSAEDSDDDMSNEEFRRTIEAFIAKQVRFHREERLAVVLHGQA